MSDGVQPEKLKDWHLVDRICLKFTKLTNRTRSGTPQWEQVSQRQFAIIFWFCLYFGKVFCSHSRHLTVAGNTGKCMALFFRSPYFHGRQIIDCLNVDALAADFCMFTRSLVLLDKTWHICVGLSFIGGVWSSVHIFSAVRISQATHYFHYYFQNACGHFVLLRELPL